MDDDGVMYKGRHSEDVWVRIAPNTHQMWKADQPSGGNAVFTAAEWWLILKHMSLGDTSKCQLAAEVGVWDKGDSLLLV
ncbi:MAG: hypothetical protein SVY53_01970 [Chloroflexota bacterium]|nr:hypothetical protein [Chloroflexota bacterium]